MAAVHHTERQRIEAACGGKTVVISRSVEVINPLAARIAVALAGLNVIRVIKIREDFLAASSEMKGITRDPIAKPQHPTATGIAMHLFWDLKSLDFFEINSTVKGYGKKLVNAVLKELPNDWEVSVSLDFSDGFWPKMRQAFPNANWAEWDLS